MCSPTAALTTANFSSGMADAYTKMDERINEGKAQSDSLKFQARIAETNALISDQNAVVSERKAALSEKEGRREAHRYQMRMDRLAGRQKAAYGASGVQVSGGTPFNVLSDTSRFSTAGEMDIKRNAAMQAWGFRTDAANYRREASGLRTQGFLYRKYGRVVRDSAIKLGWAGFITDTNKTLLSTYAMMNKGSKSNKPAPDTLPAKP